MYDGIESDVGHGTTGETRLRDGSAGAYPHPHSPTAAREDDGDSAATAERIDAWVQARLGALYERAETAVMYWENRLTREGQGRPRSERGNLGARVRRQRGARATPGAFAIEWCTFRYAFSGEGRRGCHTTYIPKGKADRYRRSALNAAARDWQRPIVEEAEDAFAAIRAVAREIAQVRTQLRAALRAERALMESSREGETPR